MTMTMHTTSVPAFTRTLRSMLGWLEKAEAHAGAKKFDPQVYLGLRLAPDMLPFSKQVQIACDAAKFAVTRLSGAEAPSFADDEQSLADLRRRVEKTIEWIESVPASAIDGTEAKSISVPRRQGAITMSGESYLKTFALPNFYFHATTTYALLRHAGVELGKSDYLGPLPN